MSLVKWGFVGLLALPAAEIAVFIAMALSIGWLRTLALFLATSLIGMIILKQAGRANRDRFRSAVVSDGMAAIQLQSRDVAAMIGGILLIFPGFITDVAGALLLLPWARRWAGRAVGRWLDPRRDASGDHAVIDLPPDQWRQVDDIGGDGIRSDDNGERKPHP
jgi:UPF0716 protein FxsA